MLLIIFQKNQIDRTAMKIEISFHLQCVSSHNNSHSINVISIIWFRFSMIEQSIWKFDWSFGSTQITFTTYNLILSNKYHLIHLTILSAEKNTESQHSQSRLLLSILRFDAILWNVFVSFFPFFLDKFLKSHTFGEQKFVWSQSM